MIDPKKPVPDDVEFRLHVIDHMTLNQKKDFHAWLTWLIEREESEPEPLEIPIQASRKVVEVKHIGTKIYRSEQVRCGKSACKSCPHGPYWYGYQRQGAKVKSWYIGKELKLKAEELSDDPPSASAPHTPAGEPPH